MEGGGASLLSAADAAAAAEEAAAESGGGGAGPTAESGESSSFWPHTRILLEKNLKLKKQQYLIPSRVMRVPLPLALIIEFLLPLGVIVLLTWFKTMTDIDVFPAGWGGDVPRGVEDPATECEAGLHYLWTRPVEPDEQRTTSCRPYAEALAIPEPFFRTLAQLHHLPHVKLALAATNPADVPKVERFREWVSREWYPRHHLDDIPCFSGEIVAGDFGWDRDAFDDLQAENCTKHGVNPGNMSSFEDVTHLVGGGTAAELQEYLESPNYMLSGPRIWAAVVFDQMGEPGEPGDWEYSVRMNFTHQDITSTVLSPVRHLSKGIRTYYIEQYAIDGFVTLQLMVDRYIIQRRVDTDAALVLSDHGFGKFEVDTRYQIDLISAWRPASLEVVAEPMRYEPQIVQFLPAPADGYRRDSFYKVVKHVFALVYTLLFMYSVFSIIATLVEEKETRVRELLRMMSVQTSALVASWFITYGAVFICLTCILTLSSTLGFGFGVFAATSPSVIFVFFFLFSTSSIGYAYTVHTFFDQAKTAGVVGMLLFFSSYFMYTAFRSEETAGWIKQSICLLSPCSFAYGLDIIVAFEEAEIGVNWGNMHEMTNGLTFSTVLFMMVVDTALYCLCGLYLEQVLPRQFGVRRSVFFPCEWIVARFGSGAGEAEGKLEAGMAFTPRGTQQSNGHAPASANDEDFEAVNVHVFQDASGSCVTVDKLRKTFDTPDGEKVAVDCLTLTMYEGQIFVLLGHNGAGKTTTINLLTGLYEPTSGDAQVYGRSIAEIDEVRKVISVCPQHDVLFLSLTVNEHLHFFGALRGLSDEEREAQVAKKIAQVGLTEKADVRAGSLSGGMKRKLSLAIALIGDSKAVFLDEPTSGMDPYSRRSTWNTLQSEKKGRVMILTTHFMEEADLLGDRIGIMAEGRLRCCGSPLFLKQRFGEGYTLAIIRNDRCVVQELEQTVLNAVPGAVMTSAVGTEVVFKLPVAAASRFPELLNALKEERLGVDQCGVGITTMEEVFCKLAAENDASAEDKTMLTAAVEEKSVKPAAAHNQSYAAEPASGTQWQEFVQHFRAMFMKRLQYGARDKIAIVFTTVLPVCMLFGGLLLLKYGEADGAFTNQLLRPMTLDQYHEDLPDGAAETTPLPFLVASDTYHQHPDVSAEVEARLRKVDRAAPTRVQIDAQVAEGQVRLYGIDYTSGIPDCDVAAYYPRSDMDWRDPRHRLQLAQERLADPGVCLSFATALTARGRGSNEMDGIVFGGLIFHDALEESVLDICRIPNVLDGIQSGTLTGGSTPGISCSVTVQARLGESVRLKVLQSTLRLGSVAIHNSTSIEPSTLVATVTSKDAGSIFTIDTGVVTIVEVDKQAGEDWTAFWSLANGCHDMDGACPAIVDQVAAFGFDCDSHLDDIDVDTIPFPPRDVRTGELIPLPRNPITGNEFTEAEFRQLAAMYLPDLVQQYAGRTLAEFCPVSCITEVCVDSNGKEQDFCRRTNRCGQDESCHYKQSAIAYPQFQCTGDELMQQVNAGHCAGTMLASDFCSSLCFSALGAWLMHCQDESAAALNEVYANSVASWMSVSALIRLSAGCDTSHLGAPRALEASTRPAGATIVYNSTSRHAAATYLNVVSNAMRSNPLTIPADEVGHIAVNNHPLPFTSHQASLLDSVKALQAVLFIMIAFAFVPGGLVVFIVREAEVQHNSKHQQMISGASVWSFWLSSYAFDVMTYLVPLVLSLLSIIWVDLAALVEDGALFACFALLLGYGLSITSCTYALSFLFTQHTKAQICTVLFNTFLGLVLMIAQFVMSQIEETQYYNDLLMPLYRLSPGFCLGHGLWTLTSSNLISQFFDETTESGGQAMSYSPLSMEVAGTDCLYLYALAIVYMMLTIGIDLAKTRPTIGAACASKSLQEVQDGPYDVDEDVAAEARRIDESTPGSVPDELIRLVRLRKVYKGGYRQPPKVALKCMSFGINVGECFGYLGINGAGKTTTMKILTNDIRATSGEAYLGGRDIATDQQAVRRLTGYCPQFDALLDKLTVREHLELFGRLKGLEEGEKLGDAVESVILMMALVPFANKLAGTLSGGNKRKLSVAIALIGGPKIIFLDEPSTGVDPVARRFMWGVISRICTQQRDCCVVLTSHVMEEVEALCTRVGIVVGGRLRCIGTNQHLKHRFGKGFCLEMKIKHPEEQAIREFCLRHRDAVSHDTLEAACSACGNAGRAATVSADDERGWTIHDMLHREGSVAPEMWAAWWIGEDAVDAVDGFISEQCGGKAKRIERQGRTLSYVLGDSTSAAEVFQVAELARQHCAVEEYGVSQSSLETIFNSFAAQQDEEVAAVRGLQKAPQVEQTPNPVAGGAQGGVTAL